ncbi:MAG: hypothetical protein ABSF28_09165 [Terracidiphilus sp.]
MTFGPCVHEKELTGLLALGHYPHACPPELRDHVSACRSCSELALVTRAFQTARAQTAAAANLASPGLLWWRAQLRRRNEAVERVGKPILGANIFALSVMLLFAIGVLPGLRNSPRNRLFIWSRSGHPLCSIPAGVSRCSFPFAPLSPCSAELSSIWPSKSNRPNPRHFLLDTKSPVPRFRASFSHEGGIAPPIYSSLLS